MDGAGGSQDVHALRYENGASNEEAAKVILANSLGASKNGEDFQVTISGSQFGFNRDLKLDFKKGFRILADASGGRLLSEFSKVRKRVAENFCRQLFGNGD